MYEFFPTTACQTLLTPLWGYVRTQEEADFVEIAVRVWILYLHSSEKKTIRIKCWNAEGMHNLSERKKTCYAWCS